MDLGFLIIIVVFLIYYFAVLLLEKKVISEPKDIIGKFLSVILLYAGISLIYFSVTGKPFLNDTPESYAVYIFIMGFVALLWTIPNLLKEFRFFNRFLKKGEKLKKGIGVKKRKRR